MGVARGSAEVTRQQVLAAARELFATRGIARVSVRDIAAAAGVNHALVHRYFGTKREMVAEILRREAAAIVGSAEHDPVSDPEESVARARAGIRYLLTDGRVTSLLLLRAELDGLAPERLVEGAPGRPLELLSRALALYVPHEPGEDPRLLAVVVGAAVLGLAAAQPLLMAGAHLDDHDPSDLLERCADLLGDLLANAIER